MVKIRQAELARTWHVGAALVSGVLYAAAFPGFDYWYLAWVCLLPSFAVLDDQNVHGIDAALFGLTMGIIAQHGTLGWVYHALRQGASLPATGALAGYVCLSLAQAFAFSAWAWGVKMLRRHHVAVGVSGPVLLVLCEWLFPTVIPTSLAYSQYRVPWLVQSLDVWGPLGVSFLVAGTTGVLFELMAKACRAWHTRRQTTDVSHSQPNTNPPRMALGWMASMAFLLAASVVYGITVTHDVLDSVAHSDRELRVGIVQSQGAPQGRQNLSLLQRRARAQSDEVVRQGAKLIVWPETNGRTNVVALPASPGQWATLALGRFLLFGTTRHTSSHNGLDHQYHSAYLASADGRYQGPHDRRIRRPLVDYTPFRATKASTPIPADSTELEAGVHTHVFEVGSVRVGVIMGYEELLRGHVRAVMQEGPEILVSLSDDWLTDGRGPNVQLALASFRAIEHRRFLIRATPAGVSAIVDPSGRIVAKTKLGTRANLVRAVSAMSGWTIYGLLGDWPGIVCLGLLAAWMVPVVARLRWVKHRMRWLARSASATHVPS